jgi:type I restriction enzyme S subunit
MSKQGWTYKKLGEVATFINGYPFKPSDWKDSGRKIIRIQNLNNPDAAFNHYDGSIDTKYIVSKGDVLISWSGSLGVFEWKEGEAILNQHIFKVVFNKGKIDKRFFEYVVDSRINEMKSKVHGITMQHITKKDFDKIPIPIPPVAEQERIVDELDLLSGIIEKKKEQLKAYDQLAQSIFYTMFGDISDTAFPIKCLNDVCEFIKDGTHQTPTYTDDKENGVKFLSAKDVVGGTINWANIKYIPIDLHKELHKRIAPQRNDILLCKNGTTGICAIVETDEIFDIYVSLALLRPRKPYCPKYLLYAINNPLTKEQFDRSLKGVGVPNLHLGEIKKARIIYPPLALQQEFAAKIEAIEQQKALIQQSIAEVQTLFDSRMDYWFG